MVTSLATAILAVSLLAAKSESPQWESDYGKALEATRADDKPLLVVLDKPAEAEARIEPSLLDKEPELLQPYKLCHVDVSTKYGKRVAEAFRAKDFPHTAIIDKSGSVVLFAKTGKMESDQWKTALATYKKGLRNGRTHHVSYKMGDEEVKFESMKESQNGGSYCPSCQRKGR